MKFQRPQRDEVSINVTPLIDVVFLLLIFIMVSSSFVRESHFQLRLPEAELQDAPPAYTGVEVVVAASGQYSINAQLLAQQDRDGLHRGLESVFAGKALDTQQLLIAADARASHQSVVTVMEVAAALGIEQVHIATLQAQGGAAAGAAAGAGDKAQ